MKTSAKGYLFLKLMGLAIIAALVFPTSVFAEGEESAAPAEPTAEETPAELPAGSPEAAETTVPEAASEELAPEAPLAELSAAAEAAGTELVAADGTPLEMASQETADALASADPYYYVGAVKYSFLVSDCPEAELGVTCFQDPNPIQYAIDYVETSGLIPTDRKIYVESGAYSGSVEVDGTLANIDQLNGLIGKDIGTGLPTINNWVYVHDMLSGFTLSGFILNGAGGADGLAHFEDNSGPLTLSDLDVKSSDGPGIHVENHAGSVNLTNVKANNNYGSGASIDNSAGGIFPVTISNSSFDHNNRTSLTPLYGMMATTLSRVTLNGVTAQDNNGHGAQVISQRGVTINHSSFNWNYSDPDGGGGGIGLYVNGEFAANAISMNSVQAHDNENSGVALFTKGTVTVTDLDAWNNTNGLEINTPESAITISNSSFNNNDFIGLHIRGTQSVTIDTIEANDNGSYGVDMDNCLLGMGTPCRGNGFVKIAGITPSYFLDNGSKGLNILSGGAVTLTNFEASGNGSQGVYIKNDYIGRSGSVTINANYVPVIGTWLNTAHDNFDEGLQVWSNGAISVDKVFSDNNGEDGIALRNFAAASAKTVTLKNSTAYQNTENGIMISSLGTITLTNTNSYDNVLQGANLNNASGNAAIAVTSTSEARFDNNLTYGLFIVSSGAITVKNVNAVSNRQGSYIDNQSSSPAAITITGSDFSNSSLSGGLYTISNGLITLQDVTSNNNALYGIYVGDDSFQYAQGANLSKVSASDNQGGSGIEVYSLGAVTLADISADGNSEYGLYINNCKNNSGLCEGSGNITLSGSHNAFNGNGEFGVYATSRGSITLSNFTANHNENSGLNLHNTWDNAAGNIKLSAASGVFNEANQNGETGVTINSNGTITIARTIAEGNAGRGVSIDNSDASGAKFVTVSDSSFSYNQNGGLRIDSTGAVTLKGVDVAGNSRYNTSISSGSTVRERVPESPYMWAGGMWESWWFNSSGTVNIQLRSSEFAPMVYLYDEEGHLLAYDDNSGSGIDAFINGFDLPAAGNYRIEVASQDDGWGFYNLALNNPIGSVSPDYSNIYGLNINNSFGTADVIIAPSGTRGNTFSDNNYYGLKVTTKGNLTINSADVSHNGSIGAWLKCESDVIKNVNLTNVQTNENQDDGLSLEAVGPVSWNGGGANGNAAFGAILYNQKSPAAKPVTVSNASFNGNQGNNGLEIFSEGNISLTNVSASFNAGPSAVGANLDNCYYTGAGCEGSGDITIRGEFEGNGFDGNGYNGVSALSNGTFKWSNASADDNGNRGLNLERDFGDSKDPVTISGSSALPATFNNNGGHGVFVATLGPISLSYVEAKDNLDGIRIHNDEAAAPQSISLNKVLAQGNSGYGIWLRASGATTASDVMAKGNTLQGLYIEAVAYPMQAVVINHSVFNDNSDSGIEINNQGDITLNGVEASGNGSRGALLISEGYKVTVLSTLGDNIFNRNAMSGFQIGNAGAVSLNKITVEANTNRGIYIENSASLYIDSASILHNQRESIFVQITGNVTINNAVVGNNDSLTDYDGIFLSDTALTSVVKITNSTVTANTGSGISLDAGVTPILTGTFYFGNDSNNNGDANIEFRP